MLKGEGDDDDLPMGSDIDEDITDEDLPVDFDGNEKDDSDVDELLSLVESSDNDVPDRLEYDRSE